MRTFIDERRTSKGEELGSEVTKTYIELEIPIGDSHACVVYIIPRSEHSAFVATCWDHAFDSILEDLDEDTAETISETWPTLATLLNNGVKDLYREGALIVLEDFDDGERKWYCTSIAGNISFENAEKVLSERTNAVLQVVLSKSVQLLTELNENQPSVLREIGKGVGGAIAATLALGVATFLGIDPDDLA